MRQALVVITFAILGLLDVSSDRVPAVGGDIVITPLIHASIQIEYIGKVVQVDPWSAGDLSSAKQADLILVTDDQSHHLDLGAIERLRKPAAPVVIPPIAKAKIPDGIALANGEQIVAAGIQIEAIAAYDLILGEPSHPKGKASGYVIGIGGKRLYVAGVTECVPEVRALRNIDVAFMPMNIPLGRMTPGALAECVRAIKPAIVYPYHFDQDYAARVANPKARSQPLPDGLTVAQSVSAFVEDMKGSGTEVRMGDWYPKRP